MTRTAAFMTALCIGAAILDAYISGPFGALAALCAFSAGLRLGGIK